MRLPYTLCLLPLLLAGLLAAGDAYFEAHQAEILASPCHASSTHLYSCGRATTRSTAAASVAFSKARLAAMAQVVDYLWARVVWPDSIPQTVRKAVWHEYLKTTNYEVILRQATPIYQNRGKDEAVVVYAIPKTGIIAETPSGETIRKTLLTPAVYNAGPIRIAVCLELAAPQIPPEMLHAFYVKVARDYTPDVAAMLRREPVAAFQIPPENDWQKVPRKALLQQLCQSPYAPELCLELGNRLQREGLTVAAKMLWQTGTYLPALHPEAAAQCAAALPEADRRPAYASPLPEPLRQNPPPVSFDAPALQLISLAPGTFPVGTTLAPQDQDFVQGQADFANNRLEEAYRHFLASAARHVTFDALNWAGNAGRRCGHEDEAAVLLLQAVLLRPDCPYPWVHLAWIFKARNAQSQLQLCLEKLQALPLDNWSQQQLHQLTQTMKAEAEAKAKAEAEAKAKAEAEAKAKAAAEAKAKAEAEAKAKAEAEAKAKAEAEAKAKAEAEAKAKAEAEAKAKAEAEAKAKAEAEAKAKAEAEAKAKAEAEAKAKAKAKAEAEAKAVVPAPEQPAEPTSAKPSEQPAATTQPPAFWFLQQAN